MSSGAPGATRNVQWCSRSDTQCPVVLQEPHAISSGAPGATRNIQSSDAPCMRHLYKLSLHYIESNVLNHTFEVAAPYMDAPSMQGFFCCLVK